MSEEVRRCEDDIDEVFVFKFADFLHWNYEQGLPACPHVLEACWSHMVSNPESREDLLFASMISMHDDAFPKMEGETAQTAPS